MHCLQLLSLYSKIIEIVHSGTTAGALLSRKDMNSRAVTLSGWNRHGHIFGWQSLKETHFLGKFLAIIFVMKENYVTNQELGFKSRYYLAQDLHSDMGIMKSLFFVSIRITHKNNIKYVCAICL